MNLHLSIDDRIATLHFDREGSEANLFDHDTLRELDERLSEIAADGKLEGLLLTSAKPRIFIAGADLHALSGSKSGELSELIELGQSVFNRLADLPIPSVAAIHGACMGGGLEIALACDWRIASDSSATKVGLPETQLGILPAWGGSTRLPQLVGLPTALPLILGGKVLKPAHAKRKGVVDEVVAREHLLAQARKWLQRGKRKARSFPLLHNPLARAIIKRKARQDLLSQTRGLYPGPKEALEVAVAAVGSSRADSLRREHDAILRLAELPETKQLIRVFFLREKARKQPKEKSPAIQQTAVIGSGVMGSGIAYWLSTRGQRVVLQDISDEALAKGMQKISKLYDTARRKRALDALEAERGIERIQPSALPVPLKRCAIVIEAASEELDIKKRIFADLSARAAGDTILATNTSALPIQELASSIEHPERLLGLHFFNPVHRMPLVEVVRTPDTSEEVIASAMAFVAGIGKIPILVRDAPGFLVNRILMPYLVEAADMFERGGDPQAIDKAMLDFGMPMGPLRLLDEVGLDVAMHVARTLSEAFPDRMGLPSIAQKLVDHGHLGRKSGEGFYHYGHDTAPGDTAMSLRRGGSGTPDDVQSRLAQRMSDEARRCLEDGIAESADDI
ncbi:MAG: 3-hydroxyacyl-CoA dehydrogenase NAD-binding domain-containing protein, partial [Akkermansiaceae bacterium]|nr:3-hydroxyacyl-CoA dehydrogenase NAD-binding domain-containing protein [Akkermansiaceae bacterium]